MGAGSSNFVEHEDLEKNNDEFESYDSVIIKAEPGDLLEFKRAGYCHWGVYVGDGEVVNVTLSKNGGKRAGLISKQSVEDVAGSSLCRVNNLTELARRKGLQANPPDVTVQKAEDQVGNKIDYNVINNNCECFAVYCRYNASFSDQWDYLRYKLIDEPLAAGGDYHMKKYLWEKGKSHGWDDDAIMDLIYDD